MQKKFVNLRKVEILIIDEAGVEDIAGLYSVDLVNLNFVDSDFKKIIIETGKLIYEK
jgi:hypothetical protein